MDDSFYPPLEKVPHAYAIVQANKYMVENADTIICYVAYFGNSRDLLAFAEGWQKNNQMPIDNIAGSVC